MNMLLLLWCLSASITCALRVVVYHSSDIGCMAWGGTTRGGLARAGAVLAAARGRHRRLRAPPPVLALLAGNTFSPLPHCGDVDQRNLVQALNYLHFNAMTLGPSDFEYGFNNFLNWIKYLNVDVVLTNLRNNITNIYKSKIITISEHRIGILGYMIPDNLDTEFANISLVDGLYAINRQAEQLKKNNVKTIIAMGYSSINIHEMVAIGCPLVDLVVSGNPNSFLYNGDASEDEVYGPYPLVFQQAGGKKVPVVTLCHGTKYIGKLLIRINRTTGNIVAWKGRPRLLDMKLDKHKIPTFFRRNSSSKSSRMSDDKQDQLLIKVPLEGARGVCLRRECNFGNLIADAMISCAAATQIQRGLPSDHWSDTAIALVHGSFIHRDVAKGEVQRKNILRAFVSNNKLVQLRIKGRHLIAALRYSVLNWGKPKYDQFLQVSGLQVEFDTRMKPRRRLRQVAARCDYCFVPEYSEVKKDSDYSLVVTEYMANGSAGFDWFPTYAAVEHIYPFTDGQCLTRTYLPQYRHTYPSIERRIVLKSSSRSVTRSTPHALLVVACVTALGGF